MSLLNFKQVSGGPEMAATVDENNKAIDDINRQVATHGEAIEKLKSEKSSANNCRQINKLNVSATKDNPKIIDIPVNSTNSFCRMPIEVLKLGDENDNVIVNAISFDNTDSTDFVCDTRKVVFDGTMHLNTSFEIEATSPKPLGNGYVTESELINISDYRNIEEVSVI